MIEIKLEQLDANSESATFIKWNYVDRDSVNKDDVVCMVETSKAVVDVLAPSDGILIHNTEVDDKVFAGDVLAVIADTSENADSIKKDLNLNKTQEDKSNAATRKSLQVDGETSFTNKARKLMDEHGISIDVFKEKALVTEKDVSEHLGVDISKKINVKIPPTDKINRVVIVTARVGGMQVLDILLNDPQVSVVGFVDDDPDLAGTNVWDIPVLGTFSDIESFWNEGRFDSAIIGYSSNVETRKKLFEKCTSIGIPMANAIDPSVRINKGCSLGQGNIICSHVHLGIETELGNNNFISANSSLDHHNKLGSHILTGPNCATSGAVEIEDGVRFGMGIFVQPQIKIGKGAVISSGSVITSSIPAGHIVKINYSQRIQEL